MQVSNVSKNTLIADNLMVADTFVKRFLGLMGKRSLPAGQGLLLAPCNSIHMFFMRFSLDVIFIDKNHQVVHLIENIKPWRVSKIISKACGTIELPVGTIAKSRTTAGDMLQF